MLTLLLLLQRRKGPHKKPKGKYLSKSSMQASAKIMQHLKWATHARHINNQVCVSLCKNINFNHKLIHVTINLWMFACQCRILVGNVLHEGLKVKLENLVVGHTSCSPLLLSTKSKAWLKMLGGFLINVSYIQYICKFGGVSCLMLGISQIWLHQDC